MDIRDYMVKDPDVTFQNNQTEYASYEVENFIKIISDYSEGDPFKVLVDPAYAGFKIFFHFDARSGLLADEAHPNSALAYLKRIGQIERYKLLKRFIHVLSMVNSITPWMFQSIKGLDEIYGAKKEDLRLHEHEISIEALETVDNKILSLVAMYREISYDYSRFIWVLPTNLRRFSASVYVYDFRMFSRDSPTASAFLQTIRNTDIKRLNHTLFDLGYCEFSDTNGAEYFADVSNNQTEPKNINLSFHCSKIVISSMFRSITGNRELTSSAFDLVMAGTGNSANLLDLVKDNSWIDRLEGVTFAEQQEEAKKLSLLQTAKNYAKDTLKNAIKEAPSYVAEQTAMIAKDLAKSKLNSLFLGNVYGFSLAEKVHQVDRINDIRQGLESAQARRHSTNDRMQSINTTSISNNLGNVNN